MRLGADVNSLGALRNLRGVRLVGRASELFWVHWDGEYRYSVFDPATGETHLFNEFPVEILRLIDRGADSVESLAIALARSCGVDNDQLWASKVERTIQDLCNLGLIEAEDAVVSAYPPVDES
jgi:PqqD family protein of HPr-rel-A system